MILHIVRRSDWESAVMSNSYVSLPQFIQRAALIFFILRIRFKKRSIKRGIPLTDQIPDYPARWIECLDERNESSGEPDSETAPRRAPVHLGLAVAAFFAVWLGAAMADAGPFDLPPSDFDIIDAAGTQVIGHGHYEVTPDGPSHAIALGEDRFNDGEYDIERDKLEMRGDVQLPRMVTFEHTYFSAKGTLQRVNKADFRTGLASCIQYKNGQPAVLSTVLQFPPDTFAGAAIILPLKGYLLRGRKDGIILYDFNCVPGPKIFKVEARTQPPSTWVHFPGELVQVDIKPDFGWLNLVIAPFVPEIRVWFSPSDDWRFVGGQFTRFYKGPEIILALVPKTAHKETGANR
jgi:hypothetical protein